MSDVKEKLKENELSFLEFWDKRRDGRVMPERADFAPEDLFPWIGHLHLLEPIDGGRDFRYAIFTTRTLVGKEQDMSGKLVSDWQDERVVHALNLYRSVVDHAKPFYNAIPERHREDWVIYSRLCVPLGQAGTVTHVVSMLTPRQRRAIGANSSNGRRPLILLNMPEKIDWVQRPRFALALRCMGLTVPAGMKGNWQSWRCRLGRNA